MLVTKRRRRHVGKKGKKGYKGRRRRCRCSRCISKSLRWPVKIEQEQEERVIEAKDVKAGNTYLVTVPNPIPEKFTDIMDWQREMRGLNGLVVTVSREAIKPVFEHVDGPHANVVGFRPVPLEWLTPALLDCKACLGTGLNAQKLPCRICAARGRYGSWPDAKCSCDHQKDQHMATGCQVRDCPCRAHQGAFAPPQVGSPPPVAPRDGPEIDYGPSGRVYRRWADGKLLVEWRVGDLVRIRASCTHAGQVRRIREIALAVGRPGNKTFQAYIEGFDGYPYDVENFEKVTDFRAGDLAMVKEVGPSGDTVPEIKVLIGRTLRVKKAMGISLELEGARTREGYSWSFNEGWLEHVQADVPPLSVMPETFAQGQRRILNVPDPITLPWVDPVDKFYVERVSKLQGKVVTLRCSESQPYRKVPCWQLMEGPGEYSGWVVPESWLSSIIIPDMVALEGTGRTASTIRALAACRDEALVARDKAVKARDEDRKQWERERDEFAEINRKQALELACRDQIRSDLNRAQVANDSLHEKNVLLEAEKKTIHNEVVSLREQVRISVDKIVALGDNIRLSCSQMGLIQRPGEPLHMLLQRTVDHVGDVKAKLAEANLSWEPTRFQALRASLVSKAKKIPGAVAFLAIGLAAAGVYFAMAVTRRIGASWAASFVQRHYDIDGRSWQDRRSPLTWTFAWACLLAVFIGMPLLLGGCFMSADHLFEEKQVVPNDVPIRAWVEARAARAKKRWL